MPETSRPGTSDARLVLASVIGLQAAWLSWLIWRSSFIDAGQRIFCLADDAMISMTYARNLVEGFGLNWARFGAPVEGFTHPLWLALMVPVQLLPLPLEWRSLVVQIAALPVMAALVVAVRRLVVRHFAVDASPWAWIAAAVGVGFYYPLAHWAVLGMETACQAVVVVVAVGLTLDITDRGEDRHRALWLVLACGYLLRMDMAILALCCQGYLGLRLRGRMWTVRWWQGLACFLALAGGYQLFRLAYFGDPLPNTYYLKLGGIPFAVRWGRGLRSLGAFGADHAVLLLAAGCGWLALGRWRLRGALLASVALAFFAYDAYVGGDVWDFTAPVRANRFVAFAVPLAMVLIAAAVNLLGARWVRTRGRQRLVGAVAMVFLLAAGDGLVTVGAQVGDNLRAISGFDRPIFTVGHAVVFRSLRTLQAQVPPGAKVAMFWAGIPQYFSDYRGVDILGYNDRQTAHGPAGRPLTAANYWPGHVKFDNARLLREVRPDAFFQTWGWTEERQNSLLPRHGYRRSEGFWIRDEVGQAQPPPR